MALDSELIEPVLQVPVICTTPLLDSNSKLKRSSIYSINVNIDLLPGMVGIPVIPALESRKIANCLVCLFETQSLYVVPSILELTV